MNKPVWRMNTVPSVPDDFDHDVIFADGCLLSSLEILSLAIILVRIQQDQWGIVSAYKTTRTSKAKYDRVYCDECGSSGQQLNESYDKLIKCPHCNGKGYTLEATE